MASWIRIPKDLSARAKRDKQVVMAVGYDGCGRNEAVFVIDHDKASVAFSVALGLTHKILNDDDFAAVKQIVSRAYARK